MGWPRGVGAGGGHRCLMRFEGTLAKAALRVMEGGTGRAGRPQLRCSGGRQPLLGGATDPWMPVSAARGAARASNSPVAGIRCLPVPAAPLTCGSGAASRVSSGRNPRLVGGRGCTAGGTGPDGRDRRTGQTDSSLGLGGCWDSGSRAPLGWGAPGASSASTCGCGCRALPRSSTPTAGTSAGRCHGGVPARPPPSLSWGLPAASGGRRPSVLPRPELCSPALCGCGDGGVLGSVVGAFGAAKPLLPALFLIRPRHRGPRGSAAAWAPRPSCSRWETQVQQNPEGLWSRRPLRFAAPSPPPSVSPSPSLRRLRSGKTLRRSQGVGDSAQSL